MIIYSLPVLSKNMQLNLMDCLLLLPMNASGTTCSMYVFIAVSARHLRFMLLDKNDGETIANNSSWNLCYATIVGWKYML